MEILRNTYWSLPLSIHFHAVKVALLAQTDVIAAIKYRSDKNLSKDFFYFSGSAEQAEILIRRLQLREVEEAHYGKNADLYQESCVEGNKESLATNFKRA